MESPNRRIERSIIAFITIGFATWSIIFIYKSSFIAIDGNRYFCLFDDAMISMRYAWNFSHGLGLVWNSGEYIQGYTNLLMTLLMSIATLAFDKSNAVLFMQVSGAVLMLAIAFVSMRIAGHIVQDAPPQRQIPVRVLSFFCALSYYPLTYWSIMGMETGLLTLLLLLGVLSAFNYTTSRKSIFLLSVAGYSGLAFLTRNDSIIFAILIWFYIILEIPDIKNNHKSIYQLLGAIGIFFLFVIGQEVFQYQYYGELVPNTYTLKLTGMPLINRIQNGIGFIRPFLKEIFLVLVLSSISLVLDFSKRKLLLLSLMLSAIGYQIYIGGDAWNYWRIMAPCMPLLMILFIDAIFAFIPSLTSSQAFRGHLLPHTRLSKKYTTWILVPLFTLIGLLLINTRFLPEIIFSTEPYQAKANQRNINTAIALNQITTSNATVGVFWAGSIPYFTDRKAIDFLGKSDRYIAHLPPDISGAVAWNGMNSVPGHNKYDLNYSIKTLEPTYVQGYKWRAQNLSQWAETRYIKVEFEGVNLFLLKDSPAVLWNKLNTP